MRSMWRQRILKMSADVTFSDPVTPHDLTEAERSLGGPLPEALAELLSETDEVSGEYGLG